MRTAAVFILSALSLSPVFSQGRQAAPPRPPATDTVAPGIPGVVAAGTPVKVLKDGLRNTEGPVALPDGSVIFTEPNGNAVTKIDAKGNFSPYAENTNRANGLGIDSKGRLIATQALTVGVIYPKGSETILAGPLPSRPNDLVIDKKDGIYYTLPGEKPPAVYYIPAGGKPILAGEVESPHGVQLSPDEKVLYVGNSHGEYLVAFDVQPDGKLTNRRDLGKFVGVTKAADTGFFNSSADGIAVDSEGRIYVGTLQGVQVFSPQGKHLGLIPVSQRPQNLGFAGPDKKTLYIAGQGAMYSVQMIAQGYKGRPK